MNGQSREIRVSDLLTAVWAKRKLIAVLAIVGLLIGIFASVISWLRGEMSKEYAVNSSFAVTSVTENGMFSSGRTLPTSGDIKLSENIVESVIYVMKSDRMLNSAIDDLGIMGISAKSIANNLQVKRYNKTNIVEITLYWHSAEEGVKILSAINSVAPKVLIDTLMVGGVSVVNDPVARYIIGGKVNAKLWVIMCALGGLLGCIYAVLLCLLRPSLIAPEDIGAQLHLQNLGLFPMRNDLFGKQLRFLQEKNRVESPLLRERFAFIAHTLEVRASRKGWKLLFACSVLKDEGRSAMLCGIGWQLAAMGKRVLLVDLDTVHPGLATLCGRKPDHQKSLNAIYRGEANLADALVPLRPGLDLLPAVLEEEALPLNEDLFAILRNAAEGYDLVLIDTSPAGRYADVLALRHLCDGAFLIVRQNATPMKLIREALERLDKAGIEVLGCVMNFVQEIRFIGGLKRESASYARTAGMPDYADEKGKTEKGTEDKQEAEKKSVLLDYILPGDAEDDAPMAGENSAGGSRFMADPDRRGRGKTQDSTGTERPFEREMPQTARNVPAASFSGNKQEETDKSGKSKIDRKRSKREGG